MELRDDPVSALPELPILETAAWSNAVRVVEPEENLDGKRRIFIPKNADHPMAIVRSHRIMPKLLRTKGAAVEIKLNKFGKKVAVVQPAGKLLLQMFSLLALLDTDAEKPVGVVESPYVELVIGIGSAIREQGVEPADIFKNLLGHMPDGTPNHEMANRLLEMLRRKARSKEFRAEVKRWKSRENRLYKGLARLSRHLFNRYKHVVVVRMDFGYRCGCQQYLHPLLLAKHLNKLQANKDHHPSIFKNCIGAAYSIEPGLEKGFHAHAIFYFSAEAPLLRQRIIAIGDAIGRYWIDGITQGSGTYWVANKERRPFERDGVGNICRDDEAKINRFLFFVAPYLTKPNEGWFLTPPPGLTWPRLFRATNIRD